MTLPPEFPYRGYAFSDQDSYQFHGVLGQGGFGDVFRVSNSAGRYYACKVFSPGIMDDPRRFKKFQREFQIGINISHEHLVSFHKSILLRQPGNERETFPAIIMDYVDGLGLYAFKKRYESLMGVPFPRHFAALLLAKACSGLDYLHRLRIQHGDLKPANILISQTGYPKITDYGIATFLGETTSQSELSGTIRYLAPEQIRRASRQEGSVDLRADIYSIGVVAMELTAGLPKILYGHPGRVLDFIVNHNEAFRDHVESSELPQDLKFVIRSCLHEELERRPQSVRELQNVLFQTIYGNKKGITLEDVGDVLKRLIALDG